jgi:hypothetical protein
MHKIGGQEQRKELPRREGRERGIDMIPVRYVTHIAPLKRDCPISSKYFCSHLICCKGCVKMEGPLLEAKVKQEEVTGICNLIPIQQKRTVNQKTFPTQAPILQTHLDALSTSTTS